MPRPKPARPTKALATRFTAEVVRLDGGIRHHLLPVPEKFARGWRTAKIRRFLVSINGHSIKRALQNHADGGSFILLGKPTVAALGLRPGASVRVEMKPDPYPDTLDIPAEFSAVLAQDAEARARWDTFTVGFRRSLLHYVCSAKQEPTRIKRSLDIARKIRTRTLHSDLERR